MEWKSTIHMLNLTSCCHVLVAFAVLVVLQLSLALTTSLVVDECRPGRDVADLRQKVAAASENEMSLVFYYVAWCSDSHTARAMYEKLALQYHERIYFVAIDCWQLTCNCSRSLASGSGSGPPDRWPTLIVHYGRYITIEYKGAWRLASLRRFLDALFAPLQRIHSVSDLAQLTMQSDAVVLALFASAHNDEYRRYAAAAIKWLEFDPERTLRFTIALGSAAQELMYTWKLSPLPSIFRISSKSGMTLFKAPVHNWNASHLVRWVRHEQQRDSATSYGYSSPERLVEQMRKGPVLTIFTNAASGNTNGDFYVQMAAIMRQHLPNFVLQNTVECVAINQGCPAPVQAFKKALTDRCLSTHYWTARHIQDYFALNTQLQAAFNAYTPNSKRYGEDLSQFYIHHITRECAPNAKAPPNVRIPIMKFLKQSIDKSTILLPNRTLSVLLLDAEEHVDFLKTHGLKLTPADAAAVFIADALTESFHIMQAPFTYASLLRFASDYYAEFLEPARQSSPMSYFSKDVETSTSYVHFDETNSAALLDRLQPPVNATYVVLLYSPTCPFSSVMLQALVQVAAMLSGSGNIQFIRLNTQVNDLPWQLVMPTTPTLIVFPRGRPAESLTFPDHVKADVRNIFGFILAQLEPIEQVRVAFMSCRKMALPHLRLRKCLLFAKDLVTQHISQHLKLWQIYKDQRHRILARLKQFKDISLDIQRSFTL